MSKDPFAGIPVEKLPDISDPEHEAAYDINPLPEPESPQPPAPVQLPAPVPLPAQL
jgi:hypothetical protein